ncbi:MAG: hypothetical protein ACOC4R_01910, partial [Bacteroidota bacterium]
LEYREIGGFDPLLFGHEGAELTHRLMERFPDKGIYYWPGMVIFHDYAQAERLDTKKKGRNWLLNISRQFLLELKKYLQRITSGEIPVLKKLVCHPSQIYQKI